MNKFFYTYVLKSLVDNRFYVGWTMDLRNRLVDHNNGKVEATKGRQPLILVYYEACLDRAKAIRRERTLKTGFGRKYIKRRI